MSTLYDQFVPVSLKYLNNASKLLDKAVLYADEKGMKHEEILEFKLGEDMKPIISQIQILCNVSKFTISRLFSLPDTYFPDDETTFAQLQQRLKGTIKLLEGVDVATIDFEKVAKVAKEEFIMNARAGTFRFESGQSYLTEYAIPNFHLRLSSTYCILKQLGVPVGDLDYLGGVFVPV